MKKIVIAFLLLMLTAPCLAASVQDKVKEVIARKNTAGAPCGVLGYNGTGDTDKGAINYTYGNEFTVGASNCSINKFYYYDRGATSGVKVRAALYAASSHLPTGDSIVVSNEITSDGSANWKTAGVATTELTAGTTYYIMILADGTPSGRGLASQNYNAYMIWASSNYPTFPTISGPGSENVNYSIYFTYE